MELKKMHATQHFHSELERGSVGFCSLVNSSCSPYMQWKAKTQLLGFSWLNYECFSFGYYINKITLN